MKYRVLRCRYSTSGHSYVAQLPPPPLLLHILSDMWNSYKGVVVGLQVGAENYYVL
jgi:hypothetical protein